MLIMNRSFVFPALLFFASLMVLASCRPHRPIRLDDLKNNEKPFSYKPYRDSQILVIYKNRPLPEQKRRIMDAISDRVNVTDLKFTTCKDCDGYVELWQAANIETVIHGEGVTAGAVRKSRGVGEDSLAYYSLNYFNQLPFDEGLKQIPDDGAIGLPPAKGKDTILVAVLDTGIDTASFSRKGYLWDSLSRNKAESDCYPAGLHGWNFVGNNGDVRDDHPNRHGTVVSQLIAKEFESSTANRLRIMVLKTHDQTGKGDLFTSICAIHYAKNHGAQIINASWGFYSYLDSLRGRTTPANPHPYLDSLLNQILPRKGALFVTASGNKVDQIDADALRIYQLANGRPLPVNYLRDLWYHNFFPACLSSDNNNVVTAVTTNGVRVSPTQNFSARFVDMGVRADSVFTNGQMKFQVPYSPASHSYVSGSSFAAAITTGKIGALLPRSIFGPGINKTAIISGLSAISSPPVLTNSPPLRDGRFVREGQTIAPHR